MAVQRFIGIGTNRTDDILDTVLDVLEREQPAVVTLDQNPVDFSTIIHMKISKELFTEQFVFDQKHFLLKRQLGVGNAAGVLYAVRNPGVPVYLVDGSFREPLSETGEEIGIYPYFTDLDFASSVDLMKVPIKLLKQRVPMYEGWDFDYMLIHAYQTDTRFEEMDRAIWQRNQFTAVALNRIMQNHDRGPLAFIGDRKRFRAELYRETPGVTEQELADYRPLAELLEVEEKVVHDGTKPMDSNR